MICCILVNVITVFMLLWGSYTRIRLSMEPREESKYHFLTFFNWSYHHCLWFHIFHLWTCNNFREKGKDRREAASIKATTQMLNVWFDFESLTIDKQIYSASCIIVMLYLNYFLIIQIIIGIYNKMIQLIRMHNVDCIYTILHFSTIMSSGH